MKATLPLPSLWSRKLIRMLGNLISIVAFIRVHKVILKCRFAKILNFPFVNWLFLLPDRDSWLLKMSFVIWCLSTPGNQDRLAARFRCLESEFLMGSSWMGLWITLLEYQSMLLNQRRTYERCGSFLRGSFFAEESLRVSVILDWLRCVYLIDSEWLLYKDLSLTLRRNWSI